MDSSEILKYLPYLLGPVIGFMVWLYKQHDSFTEDLAKRLTDVEQHRMITSCILGNIKEDIAEIKQNVTKLVDREANGKNSRR